MCDQDRRDGWAPDPFAGNTSGHDPAQQLGTLVNPSIRIQAQEEARTSHAVNTSQGIRCRVVADKPPDYVRIAGLR